MKRRIELILELAQDNPDMIGMVALRRLLKGLLQAYGIRCVSLQEQTTNGSNVQGREDADDLFSGGASA
jgi:hypothetical protein